MADERVQIPIDLTVEDIQVGNVDMSELQQELSKEMRKVMQNAVNASAQTGGSKLNKALSNSLSSLTKSYARVQSAQARFNKSIQDAGESSPKFKAALKDIQKELGPVEKQLEEFSSWGDFQNIFNTAEAKLQLGMPLTGQEQFVHDTMVQMMDTARALKKELPKPEDYASTGTASKLSTVVSQYYNMADAVKTVEERQQQWNDLVAKNKMSDEYTEQEKQLTKLQSQMNTLVQRSQQMAAVGASDKAWATINYQAQQLSKQITTVSNKMRKLVKEGSAFRFGSSKEDIAAARKNINSMLASAKASVAKVTTNMETSATPFTAEYKASLKTLNQMQAKVNQLTTKMKEMQTIGASPRAWEKMKYDATEMQTKVNNLTKELEEMVQTGKAFRFGNGDTTAEANRVSGIVNKINASLEELRTKAEQVNVPIIYILPTLYRITNILSRMTKTANQGIVRIISGLVNMSRWIITLGRSSQKSANSTNRSLTSIAGNILLIVVGLKALYSAAKRLKSTFVKAMNTLAEHSSEVEADITSLVLAFNQLKASLATAFQPVASFVIPILNRLMATMVAVMNTVGKFFAVLTGQGYIYKATQDMNDYAASIGGASDAANNALADFDEIHKLDTGSGGGGGGGSSDIIDGVGFEQEEASSYLAELIKKAWETADFTEVGQYIGVKLKAALNSIDWDAIMASAVKPAKALATFINGFIDVNGLADSLGRTIGNAINVAMTTIDTFLVTTNWPKLGRFLADWINASVATIDWALIGQTISDYFAASVNLWWNFITTVDASALVDGIITAIRTALTNATIPDETGLTLWEKLGQTLRDTLLLFLDTLNAILSDPVIADQLATGLGQLIANIDVGTILAAIATLAINVVKAIGSAIMEYAKEDPLGASMLLLFGSALVILNVASAIAPLIVLIVQLTTQMGGLGAVISTVFGAGSVFASIGLVIGGFILLVTGFASAWENGVNRVNAIMIILGATIIGVGLALAGLITWPAVLVAAIIGAIAVAVLAIKEHWEEIVGFFKAGVNMIIGFINGVIAAIVGAINTVLDFLNTMSFEVPWWVPDIGGKTFGFNFEHITAPQIPLLAQGAVIPPNKEFMAVLGDQKSGMNIEAPEGLIRQIIQEELANYGGGDINITFAGSLAQLGKVLQPIIERENKRKGGKLVTEAFV